MLKSDRLMVYYDRAMTSQAFSISYNFTDKSLNYKPLNSSRKHISEKCFIKFALLNLLLTFAVRDISTALILHKCANNSELFNMLSKY